MTPPVPAADSDHGRLLMNLVHHVTAATASRPTMELNVRQRLVVQRLGQVGEASMATVGQALGFSPSTMTGLVDRLEALGHVQRQPHPTDRRATQLSLTKSGQKVFDHEVEFYRSVVDGILETLTPEEGRAVLKGLEGVTVLAADAETEKEEAWTFN